MAITKTALRMLQAGATSPTDFGAAGTGSGDDYAEMQLAFDSGTAGETLVINMRGLTYKCNSPMTLDEDLTIVNGIFDLTGIAENTAGITCTGTASASDPIDSDGVLGDTTLDVTTGGTFTAGGLVKVETAANTECSVDATGTTGNLTGEIHRIDTIDTNLLSLDGSLRSSYTTGNGSIAYDLTTKKNIIFENATFIGTRAEHYTGGGVGEIATAGGTELTITENGHSHAINDWVYIDNVTDSGNYAASDIEGLRQITGVTANNYTVEADNPPSPTDADTLGGGWETYSKQSIGLKFTRCENVVFRNCTFRNFSKRCLEFEDCYNVIVEGCHFENAEMADIEGTCIYLKGATTNVKVVDNTATFVRNFVTCSDVDTVAGFITNLLVRGNNVRGCYRSLVRGNISHSQIENNSCDALQALTSQTPTASFTATHGMVELGMTETHCRNNIITGATQVGLWLRKLSELGSVNCIVSGNSVTSEDITCLINNTDILGGDLTRWSFTGNQFFHKDTVQTSTMAWDISDAGGSVVMANISNNIFDNLCTTSAAAYNIRFSIAAASAQTFNGVAVSGNTLRLGSATSICIVTTTGGPTYGYKYFTVTGNSGYASSSSTTFFQWGDGASTTVDQEMVCSANNTFNFPNVTLPAGGHSGTFLTDGTNGSGP